MRLRDLPQKQHFERLELYHAPPPMVSDPLGFHNNNTLAIYQGLVYYLLWLHSKYDKVGTWRVRSRGELAGLVHPQRSLQLRVVGRAKGQDAEQV